MQVGFQTETNELFNLNIKDMESKIQNAALVEKEAIANFTFPDKEILESEDAVKLRRQELERAMKLGNVEKGKIKIVFEDSEGPKQVDTTIWGVTDKRIILKQGLVIPINRILAVKI